MDADERTTQRIVNGVAGLIGLWLLAQFVPAFVAAVLMTASCPWIHPISSENGHEHRLRAGTSSS